MKTLLGELLLLLKCRLFDHLQRLVVEQTARRTLIDWLSACLATTIAFILLG